MDDMKRIGFEAKKAAFQMLALTEEEKNHCLIAAADELLSQVENILEANRKDMESAEQKELSSGMKDRLLLTKERLSGMASGLISLSKLPDPIGKIRSESRLKNGLHITKRCVPLGVIGIIYEARPNVTSDAFGIAFKAGNAVILRGGSDAMHSNRAIVSALKDGMKKAGAPVFALQLMEDPSRESAKALMHSNGYVDALIPRGSASLIQTVLRESTVPVIETGAGNCHIYVDETADLKKAVSIVINAKTQRIGVCNALESLVLHRLIAGEFLRFFQESLKETPYSVELRGDEEARSYVPDMLPATESDWESEYLDYILSVKTVGSIDEAISHINRYHTMHSDAIITESEENAKKFLRYVDSACVYVNASTRFTDGQEFGLGAEIGISTQKLHARGPMGLEELTSYKYEIIGDGQIRI